MDRVLTEEGEVRCWVADELDERLPQGLSELGVWRDDVHGGEDGKPDSDANYLQGLQHHVLPPEAGQSFVPDGRQKLLDIGVCHKLRTDMITVTVAQ